MNEKKLQNYFVRVSKLFQFKLMPLVEFALGIIRYALLGEVDDHSVLSAADAIVAPRLLRHGFDGLKKLVFVHNAVRGFVTVAEIVVAVVGFPKSYVALFFTEVMVGNDGRGRYYHLIVNVFYHNTFACRV